VHMRFMCTYRSLKILKKITHILSILLHRCIKFHVRIPRNEGAVKKKIVRICCIGLVDLHHLFYKGAAGPLGLQASSPVATTPSGASPGVDPLGLQGRQPIRVRGVRHPWCRIPWLALGGLLPL
jgi:hypothetical protein